MALSHSSVALPTKAALICSEPAAALRLGRELVSHGLGGAKRIGTDLPALGGTSDAASPTTSTEEDLASTYDDGYDRTGVSRKERRLGRRNSFFSAVFFWPSPHVNPPSPGVSGRPQV